MKADRQAGPILLLIRARLQMAEKLISDTLCNKGTASAGPIMSMEQVGLLAPAKITLPRR
jgi:hypothetical protein